MLQVNCNQCVEAYFTTAKLGAIYVPLNFRAKGDELTYMLDSSEANTLFVGESYIELINSISATLTLGKNFISIDSKHNGMLYYEDIISSSPAEEMVTDISDDDTTILMYTAGTTGLPKGVMLSHDSFTIYVLENVTPTDPELEEKNILTVPLYHVAGIQVMMAAIYGGRTLVIEQQFETWEWMELVETEKVNPDFGKHDLSSRERW